MKTWITYLLCFLVTTTWMFLRLNSGHNNFGNVVLVSLAFIVGLVLLTQYKKTIKEKMVIFLFSTLFSAAGLLVAVVVFGLIWASIGKIGG